MDLYYSRQYSAAVDAFDTTRKAGWIAESLAAGARCWRRWKRAGEGVSGPWNNREEE